MLSCGALERSNDPYVESIVEPCFSKNQKGTFACVGFIGEKKSWKRVEATEKSIPELKAEFVDVCERKKYQFWNSCNYLRYIRNANLPFKKDFKFAEFLTKRSFFFYFRDSPKNGEGNKLRRRRKYMRKSN